MRLLELFWGSGDGGDATATVELLRAMADRGIAFELVAYADPYPSIFESRCKRAELGTRFISDPGNLWSETGMSRKSFDLLHCHYGGAMPTHADVMKIRRAARGLPVVLSAYGGDPLWAIEWEGLLDRVEGFLVARRFDTIVVPSKTKLQEWHESNRLARNITHIPPYTRPLRRGDRDEARKRWSLPDDAEVILFCGSFDDEKDPETFIRAINTLKKTRPKALGVMAGVGPLMSSCAELIQSLNAPVVIAGYVDDLDLIYSGADVFVQTSLAESLGFALFQAAEFGLPCVASSIPVFREMYERLPSFRWFEPAISESCASALQQCFDQVTAGDCAITGMSIDRGYSSDMLVESYYGVWHHAIERHKRKKD